MGSSKNYWNTRKQIWVITPTGKKFVIAAVPMCRVVEGKIIEGWSVWDRLSLFKQLGVIE